MDVELGEKLGKARHRGCFADFWSGVMGVEVAERGTGSKEIEELGRKFVCH